MAMEPSPDFWFPPPRATNRRRAPPIDPVFFIILIPILALLFLFFFLPPFLSHTSHIMLKPSSVKSTWDSLNIFLILFAILCGVMAPKNDDASSSSDGFVTGSSSSSDQSSAPCVGFPDPKVVSGGLIRRSGSNPVWFSDDFDVDTWMESEIENLNRSTPVSGGVHRRSRRSEEDLVDFSDVKEIGVDTFVASQNAPEFREQVLAKTPPPPPPPPSVPSSGSKRHSFRSVGRNIKLEAPMNTESDDYDRSRSLPPFPPPPPAEVRVHRLNHKHKTLDRKIGDVATAISSLYNQRKTKNKQKLRNNSIRIIRSPEIKVQQPTPPPPPPPPPSVFQNLFRKGSKHKRIHSVPAIISSPIPPPPPPPPIPPRKPSSIFNSIFKSGSKSKRFNSPSPDPSSSSSINSLFGANSKRFNYINPAPSPPPMTTHRYTVLVKSKQLSKSEPQNRRCTSKGKPPLPTKTTSYYGRENTSGSESPLIPMPPPPPPPPPFKMPAMKFEVRGDFVKIRSTHSSVCSSPDHDHVDLSPTMMELELDGGDSIGPGCGLGSCPSPDVNAKADSFISRLKGEWRMEKINCVKEKMG